MSGILIFPTSNEKISELVAWCSESFDGLFTLINILLFQNSLDYLFSLQCQSVDLWEHQFDRRISLSLECYHKMLKKFVSSFYDLVTFLIRSFARACFAVLFDAYVFRSWLY